MRVGIMQPYFFPYPGHFSLIAHTQSWIVFDTTQYTPKTWMNRNRVLHPNDGWNWLSVPLSNSTTSISTHEAQVLDPLAARRTVLGKLSHYRRHAPFCRQVEAIVDEAFDACASDRSLVHLNVRGLAAVCRYLDLPFQYQICSEMDLALPLGLAPGDWALEICRRIGADAYLNPVGGRELFDPRKYRDHGVTLEFLQADAFDYPTDGYQAMSGLSILDALMWCKPERVCTAIREGVKILEATSHG